MNTEVCQTSEYTEYPYVGAKYLATANVIRERITNNQITRDNSE